MIYFLAWIVLSLAFGHWLPAAVVVLGSWFFRQTFGPVSERWARRWAALASLRTHLRRDAIAAVCSTAFLFAHWLEFVRTSRELGWLFR